MSTDAKENTSWLARFERGYQRFISGVENAVTRAVEGTEAYLARVRAWMRPPTNQS